MLHLLCCSMEIKFEMAMNRYWHWVSSDHGSYEDYKARITRPLCRLRLGNGKSRVSCGPCHISTVQCLQGQEVRHLRVPQQHQVEAQPGSCGRPWPWPWNVMNTEDCFKIRFVTQVYRVYRLGFLKWIQNVSGIFLAIYDDLSSHGSTSQVSWKFH